MKINKLLIIPDKLNLTSCVDLAVQYNLGFEYNDFYMPEVLDNQSLVEELVSLYKSTDSIPEYCTSHGAFLDITIFSDDSLIRQISDKRVEQSIEIAKKLGTKGVIFHTNYVSNFKNQAYEDNWVKRNAIYWKEKLNKYNDIDIYIENMFDREPVLLARLGEALKDEEHFGVCFDYAHAHAFGGEVNIEEWVDTLAPYVKHLHINDNDLLDDLHMTVGEGSIDWVRFKEFYEKYFSETSVVLEVTGIDKIKKSLEFIYKL